MTGQAYKQVLQPAPIFFAVLQPALAHISLALNNTTRGKGMVAKTSEARRRAFFRALAATGNQTLAAERAKVSRSWVTLHRSADPAFKAEMEAATATAKARLDEAAGVGPMEAWRAQNGEELAVRGAAGARPQISRARLKQWTPRAESRFLGALAASCNVRAACAETGLSVASAYNHRQRWPGFAERWKEALETGHLRIEAALLHAAGSMWDAVDYDPDAPLAVTSFDQVIRLLRLHERSVRRPARRPGRAAREPTIEQARASVLKAIERAERVSAREETARRVQGYRAGTK